MSVSATTIGTLRVRGAGEDTPALRLGLTSLLATGDLQPSALPPAAILIVRRLGDPLPRRLPSRRRTVRIDRVWERATRDVLEQHYRRAHRPRRSGVPDNAEAVLFEDEAELLACLARDICSGRVHGRWWWKHVRVAIDADRPASLERVLIERATHVPAALAQLHASGEMDDVVNTLAPDAARRTLASVAQVYECDALLAAIAAAEGRRAAPAVASTTIPQQVRSDSREQAPQPPTKSIATQTAVTPPWQSVAPDILIRASDPWRAALAGIAVALHRRPSAVRTATFARMFGEWILETESRATPSSPLPPSSRDQSIAVAQRASDGRRAVDEHRAAVATSVPGEDAHAGTSRQTVQHAQIEERIDEPVTHAAARPATSVPDAIAPQRVRLTGVAIATDLGGVFYLLNAMRYLDLPQGFEDDWHLASGVGAWGTLEAVAAGLLGDDLAAKASDGIWTVLADLDGRPPGTPVTACMSPACTEWLSLTLPSIRRRLAEAFGLPDEEWRAVGMLLRHTARVHLTASHVDVTFPIDFVSLPVRMAGLDRDPGWAPAYGRVITFHYE